MDKDVGEGESVGGKDGSIRSESPFEIGVEDGGKTLGEHFC